MARQPLSEERLGINVDYLVPAGRHNAQAIRFFRQFFTRVLENIQETERAQETAEAGLADAQSAQTAAQAAQELADENLQDLIDQEAQIDAIAQALADHVAFQATQVQLGHVYQAGAVSPLSAPALTPPSALYVQSEQAAQNSKIDAVAGKIDDLISALRSAGIVA